MSYASLSDLTTYGLPTSALGPVTSGQQQAALDAASAYMDTKFRGRYALPLLAPFSPELVMCCAELAAERVLKIRGYDPTNAGDAAIVDAANLQRTWLDQVQRSAAHPDVNPSPAQTPNYNSPKVFTSSVVATNSGVTDTTRGW